MLSVRVVAPTILATDLRERLESDPTVSNLAVAEAAADHGRSDVLFFELARENANTVIRMLRHAGVPEVGSIVVSDTLAVISDAADAAERAAPGHPGDGVVWAQLRATATDDSRPSRSFFAFLVLAVLIAGVGRILDQPILIIGAMVVGPEFAPLAAIAYAIVARRHRIIPLAALTVLGGFAAAALVSWVVWGVVAAFGIISFEQATSGPLTNFIVSPDAWSFVVAVLAGVAGMLSLTTSKSSALVGVFISVTTVPAVAAIGLTAAVGAWDETLGAAVQLGVNIVGILLAGTATLWVQLIVGRRVGLRLEQRRRDRDRART